jgi:phage gp29-like protein
MAKKKKPAAGASKSAVRPVVRDTSETVVASQPSVRSTVLWTPALLQSLSLQADSGDLYRLGDLVEQMLADDRIPELLDTLVGDVLSADLTFEKDARSKVGDAEKADELDTDWPLGYDDDELKQLGMWTLMTGVGFCKHEAWLDSEGGRIVPLLKWWHPKQFLYRQFPITDRTWLVRDENGGQTPLAAGDGTWVILTRRGEFRPWANGLWRELCWWWMLKRCAIQDWGVHSEKSSKLVVNSDNETTAEMRKGIAKYVYEASKDAVISLPPGFKMELIELSANTREIYQAQVDAANAAFAIAILGQNLTSDVSSGSLAAAEVHERKENRKVTGVAKMLAKGLQQQSIAWWAEYNFGDRALAPYPRWDTDPPEDSSAKATTFKTTADGLVSLKNAGYKLKPEQIETDFGLVVEEVEPPAPVPVPGQPGVPGKPVAPKPPAKKPAPAQARFLASGDDPASVPGYVAGQVYVDALTDKSTALAADDHDGFVERLLEAIDGCEDYSQVRRAVLDAYAEEDDPERLAELVEHGMLLANLAGRHAVAEDVPAQKPKGAAEDVAKLAEELLSSEADIDPTTLKTRLGQSGNAIAALAASMLGQLNQ